MIASGAKVSVSMKIAVAVDLLTARKFFEPAKHVATTTAQIVVMCSDCGRCERCLEHKDCRGCGSTLCAKILGSCE